MIVHVPFRFLFIERLVTVCVPKQTHNRNRHVLVQLTERSRIARTFCTSSVRSNENEEDSADFSRLSTKLASRQDLLSRRRQHLSPLERISSLLPKDVLSPEVMQLREERLQEPDRKANIQMLDSDSIQQENGPNGDPKEELEPQHAVETTPSSLLEEEQVSPSLPGETLLSFGELLVAEHRKKKQMEFRNLFQLRKSANLQSVWGVVLHNDIVGQPAGCFHKTKTGAHIFIRRASLEDYVLYMRRGPAISYPKVKCLKTSNWEQFQSKSWWMTSVVRMRPPCWWWWMWRRGIVCWSQALGRGPCLCFYPEQVCSHPTVCLASSFFMTGLKAQFRCKMAITQFTKLNFFFFLHSTDRLVLQALTDLATSV